MLRSLRPSPRARDDWRDENKAHPKAADALMHRLLPLGGSWRRRRGNEVGVFGEGGDACGDEEEEYGSAFDGAEDGHDAPVYRE